MAHVFSISKDIQGKYEELRQKEKATYQLMFLQIMLDKYGIVEIILALSSQSLCY